MINISITGWVLFIKVTLIKIEANTINLISSGYILCKIAALEVADGLFSFLKFLQTTWFLVYKTNVLFKLHKLIFLLYILLGGILFSGLWVFSSKRKHLLSALLSLEYIVLAIFFMFFTFIFSRNMFFSLLYLTFAACEGALGLSILVIMSRTHGGDYFRSFNFL